MYIIYTCFYFLFIPTYLYLLFSVMHHM